MRVAFAVIIVFLVAQVIWWTVFQHQYIQRTVQQTQTQWQSEATLAQIALQSARRESRSALIDALQSQSAHLNLSSNPVSVNAAALEAFKARQQRYLNMFNYEVPFFLAVMLTGLWVIARSARSDFELQRRQQNFLMAATHEFRTPISTLRLLVETAQYRELDRIKQLELLHGMNGEVSKLQTVSERVLATARLEQGTGVQTLEIRDLRGVTRQLLEPHRAKLNTADVHLEINLPDAPVRVAVDAAAFGIVLSNLLENAVKYTGDVKHITLTLEARGKNAELSVSDNGIGIDAATRPHIFDQFYRAGNELTRSASGLGLGLYLVRGITELMGGSVRCDPLTPHGTRFTVSLPLVADAAPQTASRRVHT